MLEENLINFPDSCIRCLPGVASINNNNNNNKTTTKARCTKPNQRQKK